MPTVPFPAPHFRLPPRASEPARAAARRFYSILSAPHRRAEIQFVGVLRLGGSVRLPTSFCTKRNRRAQDTLGNAICSRFACNSQLVVALRDQRLERLRLPRRAPFPRQVLPSTPLPRQVPPALAAHVDTVTLSQ